MTPASAETGSSAQMLRVIEDDIKRAVEAIPVSPAYDKMRRMVSFHFGWEPQAPNPSGKRVRPLLTLLTAQAAGGDWRTAVPAATGIELIHNFSLIHDDIEDQSDTRRGRPTLWQAWGLAQALNTGDALLVLSHMSGRRMADLGLPHALCLEAQSIMDHACLNLTGGQHLDLAFEQQDSVAETDYLEMIQGKTAALLAAATHIGALIAGAEPTRGGDFRDFGAHMGMAFQIQDDILGIWGAPEVTGKPAGDDLKARKQTLPVVFGLAECPEFAQVWRSPSRDQRAIERMTTQLEACGALEHARKLASQHTHSALGHLKSAEPASPAAEELAGLADRLLRRES